MNLESIINLVLNLVNLIYNYIDKFVIKLLINLVKQPMALFNDTFNFKNQLINNYYDTILSTIKYQESKIQVVNKDNNSIDILNDISSKPSLILQNHLAPKNDILTSMYIMNKYLPNNSTFLGSVFASFRFKFMNDIFNNLIKSIVKEISMIYIDWDISQNKPEKNQLDRVKSEASKLHSSNCNLLIYPEGKPTSNNLDLESFKTGYKHILKETEYNNIILLSVIYTDDNNNLLLDKSLIENNNFQTRVMIENIEVDKKSNLSEEYLENLEKDLKNKMKHNLDNLVKAYVK